jgi:hypothetical protein
MTALVKSSQLVSAAAGSFVTPVKKPFLDGLVLLCVFRAKFNSQ